MVRSRRGASSIGCLLTLLIVAAVIYFGVNAAEAYWRFYEFRDAMKQEIIFNPQVSNARIIAKLRNFADSLGLPEDAQDIAIDRTPGHLLISADYTEHIEMPGYSREVRFRPKAEGSF